MSDKSQISGDGGPAFPTTKPLEHWGDPNAGMSLRDYFAAAAATGIEGNYAACDWSADRVAARAYRVADAMLKARQS